MQKRVNQVVALLLSYFLLGLCAFSFTSKVSVDKNPAMKMMIVVSLLSQSTISSIKKFPYLTLA